MAGVDAERGSITRSRLRAPTTDAGEDPPEPNEHAAPLVERTLGRYEVRELVGRGGMGIVYQAWDPKLERLVALKLISPRRVGDSSRAQGRFVREALALAALSHPNIVSVYEASWHAGIFFIAMELVEGPTLQQWAEAEPRAAREVVRKFIDAGRGLAHAHHCGLVHRDFKPSNVVVGRDGRARVLDFGLAKLVEPASASQLPTKLGSTEASTLGVTLTNHGDIVGTPSFTAPEQTTSRGDERTDQYAFCIALWVTLCGELPFAGATFHDQIANKRTGAIKTPADRRAIPARVLRVLRRGLSPHPSDRYPSMSALLRRLERATSPPKHRPAKVLAVAGLAATALIVGRFDSGPDCERDAQQAGKALEPARARIERAMTASNASLASETWRLTEARLDDYAAHWQAAFSDICRDARAHDADVSADPRLSCLEDRLAEYRSVLQVLESANPRLVTRAVRTALSLPPAATCRQPLLAPWEVPAGDSSFARRLRHRLAVVAALQSGGDYKLAHSEAVEVLNATERWNEGSLRAAAQLALAEATLEVSDPNDAESQFEAAYFTAVELEQLGIATRAAINLARVVGNQLAHHERGLTWARMAQSHLDAPGRPDALVTDLHSALGSIYFEMGRFADAARELELAVVLSERDGDVSPLRRAGFLSDVAVVWANRGELDRARHAFEEVVEIRSNALGGAHPDVGTALGNLANVLADSGRTDEALVLQREQLGILDAALGDDQPTVIAALVNLATTEVALGEHKEAVVHLDRAHAALKATFGDDHPMLARVYLGLGEVRQVEGDHDAANRLFVKGLTIWEAATHDHPATAYVLLQQSQSLLQLGRGEEAVQHLERAARIADSKDFDRKLGAKVLAALRLARQGKTLDDNIPSEAGESAQ